MSTNEQQTPEIKILNALTVVEEQEKFTYPNLQKHLGDIALGNFESGLWAEFNAAEEGSVEEGAAARNLARLYGVLMVDKNVKTGSELWATRFTEAMTELYDTEISKDEWQGFIAAQLNGLEEGPKKGDYVEALQEFGVNPDAAEMVSVPGIDKKWIDYASQRYSEIDRYLPEQDPPYSPRDLQSAFQAVIEGLKDNDGNVVFEGWRVEIDSHRSAAMVVSDERKIVVGEKRSDITSALGLKKLVVHEIMTHAARGAAGYRLEDKLVVNGLPGYLDAEEGLAVLSEEVATRSKTDPKRFNRAVEIGLALGYGGVIPSREDMVGLVAKRMMAEKPSLAEGDAKSKAAKHLQRIYRGGAGDEPKGQRPAVFTKDAAYLLGYMKMVGYINKQIRSGVNPENLWEYMHAGKFDPTNADHVKYMASKGVVL